MERVANAVDLPRTRPQSAGNLIGRAAGDALNREADSARDRFTGGSTPGVSGAGGPNCPAAHAHRDGVEVSRRRWERADSCVVVLSSAEVDSGRMRWHLGRKNPSSNGVVGTV